MQQRRETNSSARLVAFNTAVQVAARAIAALFGVVQVAVLSHYLGSKGYGEYGFVLAVIGMGSMLTDMGLGQVAVRALSGQDVSVRSETLGALLSARIYLAFAAVLTTGIFALLAPIDSIERAGVILMSATYLVSIPAVISAIYQAELELQFSLAIAIAQTAATLAVTVVLVFIRAPLLGLLVAQILPVAGGAAALFVVAVRRYHISFRLKFRQGVRTLRESLPVAISQLLVVLYFRIDTILIGLLRGPTDVAYYSAGYKFVDLGSFAGLAFMSAVFPLMVRRGRAPERARLLTAYQRSTDLMMFVAIPLTVAILILAKSIIFLIFPSDFGPSVDSLRILCLTLIPLFVNMVLGSLVLSIHAERTFLWVSLGATILNISCNIVFIPVYGIVAASIITVISEVFVTIVATYIMWRALRFLPSLRASARALGASLVMAVPMYVLRDQWVVAALLGGLIYLGTTRVLGIWSWAEVRSAMALESVSGS